LKLLQLNLNHCEAAQDLLWQTIHEWKPDVAILCEQYKNLDDAAWVSDYSGKSAIWSCAGLATQESPQCFPGYVRAKINGIHIYSCYAPPNEPIEQFNYFLDCLVLDARDHSPTVISGDFNAWATEWGSAQTNRRGQALLEAFSSLDVVLCNTGSAYTFRRGNAGSVIDLTFVSESLWRRGISWQVCDFYTHSDHQAILCELHETHTTSSLQIAGWKTNNFDEDIFRFMFRDTILTDTANTKASLLIGSITNACNATMPKRRLNPRRPPAYWWNEEIALLRRKCNHARRVSQRSRNTNSSSSLQQIYKEARRALKVAIKLSKRRCWKSLCDEVENDPWGRPYKMVMSKLKPVSAVPTCPILMDNIVSSLFPQRPVTKSASKIEIDDVPLFTIDELMFASRRIPNKKAPGPDYIPNVALKAAILEKPEEFLEVYNSCLREGTFPEIWKKQKLILIPKGKANPEDPSSFRPICLLDGAGKLLERLLGNRLEEAIVSSGGLAHNQYGFRKARSTVDAIQLVTSLAEDAISGRRWKGGRKQYCAIVTLDIKNAFNTARWEHIMNALSTRNVPCYIRQVIASYFENRTLQYYTDEGCKEYTVTCGVPQGSVLGPMLWNIMYDDIFALQVPEEATVVGFADDIAIVAVSKYKEELENICRDAVDIIQQWLDSVGLQLAEQKTEAVLITSRKVLESISIRIGTHTISSQPSIRYLGVQIDARLSFKEHTKYVSQRSAKASKALSRIMPNVGGPSQGRRRLLVSVVTSIMLYAAPIWAQALQVPSYRRSVNSVYRNCALRVISAFRTLSDEAACVIAGMCPINLLAAERQKLYKNGHGGTPGRPMVQASNTRVYREDILTDWQQRWTLSEKGYWTRRLIPEIAPWINRQHGEVDFYLTQLLSGHGCFRAYLHRFGHDDSPYCPSCSDTVEDAEHVFFVCPRFQENREGLAGVLDQDDISPENIVEVMLASPDTWSAVANFAATTIKELRRLERQRRQTR